MTRFKPLFLLFFTLGASLALAQDAPADNMDILRDKIRADKKLVVAANMGLTESEAAAFWPVYEDYQKDLTSLNKRLAMLIDSYAVDYSADTLTDAKAAELLDEMLAIEQAEVDLHKSYLPKLKDALPATKVARYMQIERKIRALITYELAAEVPLAE